MSKAQTQPRSPYQRKGKTPYRYSDTYQNWKRAALAGQSDAAREYAREHRQKFGPVVGEKVLTPLGPMLYHGVYDPKGNLYGWKFDPPLPPETFRKPNNEWEFFGEYDE